MNLRLTFDEEALKAPNSIPYEPLEYTNYIQGTPRAQVIFKQVHIYTTKFLTTDEFIENRLFIGLNSAGFQTIVLNSINNIVNELLLIKPAGAIIVVDDFDEAFLLTSFITNKEVWNSITKSTTLVIASARAGNPTFRSSWEFSVQLYVYQNPPDIVEMIALFNRSKPAEEIIPFELNIAMSELIVRPGFDSFVNFSVTAPQNPGYIVTLRTEGVPAFSISEPIPQSGTPPFDGVLKTNIGIVTQVGRHPISLIGEGGGLVKSDVITYITR